MATVFEIVKKLRDGEEVVLNNRYRATVMQQMIEHEIGQILIDFKQHDKSHFVMRQSN